MRSRKIIAVFALILILAAGAVYTVLFGRPLEKKEDPAGSQQTAVAEPGSSRAQIILDGDSIQVSGTGAAADGNVLTIGRAGTYLISGRLTEGQIIVDTEDKSAVILQLNGASVTNTSGPALFVRNSNGLLIYMQEGTVNTFVSGKEKEISAQSADSAATGGAVMLSDDAAIGGKGTLRIYGYINNGIHCSNDLVIDSATIEVTAVNNGIKGKDSLTVNGGILNIASGGDGLKSDDETDGNTGILTVNAGTITVTSFDEGLKATSQIVLNGGEISLECGGDGVNCDGDIVIEGSSLTVKCADDGVHADGDITVGSGAVTVSASTEGVEGKNITVNGGTVSITSSDDGFNCTDGRGSQPGWRPGGAFSSGELPMLVINGGIVYVNAQGDGLDSNGDMIINGGGIIVDGPSGNGNGSLDSGTESGGTITVNGGTILSVGSSGMVEMPQNSSRQISFVYNAPFNAGTLIRITDSKGNVLVEHTTAKSGGNIIFSSPDLEMNGEYVLQVGSVSYDIIITENVTVYGQTGGFPGGPGGAMGPGGGPGGPQDPGGYGRPGRP